MFMKWAKTKAMESCWGEENMKLHTLNMKKAVSKCLQVDAPETELPPFRYLNRFTNNLVNMANNNHGYGHNNEDQMMKMMKMMMKITTPPDIIALDATATVMTASQARVPK